MRPGLIIAICLIVFAALAPREGRADTPVSIELVLAVDTSLSVNDIEYGLQMRGIAQAFRTPEIIELIGQHDGVAVALIQWAGWVNKEPAIPWRLLTTEASVLAFADEVDAVKRETVGYQTAIGTAIAAGLHAIATNRFAGERLKIDLSGDGQNNAGPEPDQSKARAAALGVTVNGLAILTDYSDLDVYFRLQVMSGPSAFVIPAENYHDFPRAMRLKLLRELAVVISRHDVDRPRRTGMVRGGGFPR